MIREQPVCESIYGRFAHRMTWSQDPGDLFVDPYEWSQISHYSNKIFQRAKESTSSTEKYEVIVFENIELFQRGYPGIQKLGIDRREEDGTGIQELGIGLFQKEVRWNKGIRN